MGVVSGCCCKEVYRFRHNSSFFAVASLLLCSFLKTFFVLVYVILCNIANAAQRTFEIIQKSRSRRHADIIISTRTYVHRLHT